jgi:hypothetical protein
MFCYTWTCWVLRVLIPFLKSPFLDCEPIDARVEYQDVQEEFDKQAPAELGGVNYYLEFSKQPSVDP